MITATSLLQSPNQLFALAIGFRFSPCDDCEDLVQCKGFVNEQLSCIVVNLPPLPPSFPFSLRPSICDCSVVRTFEQTEQQDVDVVLRAHMIATMFDVNLSFTSMGSAHLHFPPLPALPLPPLLYIYIVY